MRDLPVSKWKFPIEYAKTCISPWEPIQEITILYMLNGDMNTNYWLLALTPTSLQISPSLVGPLPIEHWAVPLEYSREVESILLLGVSPYEFAIQHFPECYRGGINRDY